MHSHSQSPALGTAHDRHGDAQNRTPNPTQQLSSAMLFGQDEPFEEVLDAHRLGLYLQWGRRIGIWIELETITHAWRVKLRY